MTYQKLMTDSEVIVLTVLPVTLSGDMLIFTEIEKKLGNDMKNRSLNLVLIILTAHARVKKTVMST